MKQDSLGLYNSYIKFSIPYATHYFPHGMSVGDYNNDGSKDIAIVDYNNGLVLLRNNSTATNYFQIDTLVSSDTILVNSYIDSTFITVTLFNTTPGYHITQTDEYGIFSTYETQQITTDTVIVRYVNSCNGPFSESDSSSQIDYITNLISIDSLLLSSTIDSVKIIIPDSVFIVGEISVYPNPSGGEFTIELPEIYADQTELEIYNDIGQIVSRFQYSDKNNKREIHLTDYACGTYFMKVKSTVHSDESLHKLVITQ